MLFCSYAIRLGRGVDLFLERRGFSRGSRASQSAVDEEQGIRKEIAVQKKLDHPCIVRLFEVLDDESKNEMYLGESPLCSKNRFKRHPCSPGVLGERDCDGGGHGRAYSGGQMPFLFRRYVARRGVL